MDKKLKEQNLSARDTTPMPIELVGRWKTGNTLQTFFSSVGCRFRDAGCCSMCNYGGYRNLTEEEAVDGLVYVLSEESEIPKELLLGTCGSILDEREMSWEVLEAVLRKVMEYPIPTIIFETHYTTIQSELLQKLKSCLPGREIVIELGFESANP